jgi:Flp pilus assembly protein TadD
MHIDTGRDAEALRVLAPHLALHPDDPRGLALAASAHIALGEFSVAKSEAARATSLAPQESWIRRVFAITLAKAGEHDAAVAAAGDAIRLAPHDWSSYHCRAIVDVVANRVTLETLAIANRAVALNPTSPDVHLLIGDIAMNRRDRDMARAAYSEALRLDPSSAIARNNLATMARGPDRAGKAAATFMDIAASQPGLALAVHNVRVTVTQATSTLHLIVWLHWVIAYAAFSPVVAGVGVSDPTYGPALRIALAVSATIALTIYVLRLRAALGARFGSFFRTIGHFRRRLATWLIAIATVYVLLIAAACMPPPWFRVAYFSCLVALVVGTVNSARINKSLKADSAALDS